MSFSRIKPQKKLFYTPKWTPEMDVVLLSSLIRQKNIYQWKSSNIPSEAMRYVCFQVNEMFPGAHTWGDDYDRKEHLETRYWTFKQIIDVPKVFWDLQQHCIIADDKIWKEIFKGNIFVKAYYHNDEPEFQKLALVFGDDDIKVESEKTVIVISDSTQAVGENQKYTRKVAGDEEVTSPNLGKPRRRLFRDCTQLQDVESTNNRGRHYIVEGPNGDEKFSMVNAIPTKPKEMVSNASRAEGSSSCASSSPSKWWKNMF